MVRSGGDGAAHRLNCSLGTGGRADALEHDLLGQFTGLDDLDHLGQFADQARLLERQQVDLGRAQALQIGQRDLGVEFQQRRFEAALGQPALQRHLAAFETDLVITTGTRLLTFVATTRRFAQARTNATADAALVVLGAFCRLDAVEFHVRSLEPQSTLTRYETLLIMPRTAGVSSSVYSLLSLRSPRPRTVARWDSRVPAMLRTSLTVTVFLSVMMLFPSRSLSRESVRPSGHAWRRFPRAC